MAHAFSRTEMVLGTESMNLLSQSRVAVFGIGGVGGFVVEGLARAGIGALDLIDNDQVCLTNLNRQIIALHSTLGMDKVDAAAARVHDIHPECRVRAIRTFFLPENRDQFDFSAYDYVVDAIDTVTAKLALIAACRDAGTPIVSCMGTGNKVDPSLLRLDDISRTSICPLARVMRRELRRRGIEHLDVLYSLEPAIRPVLEPEETDSAARRRDTPGSVSFVPSVAGLMIAGKVILDLIHFDRNQRS